MPMGAKEEARSMQNNFYLPRDDKYLPRDEEVAAYSEYACLKGRPMILLSARTLP